MYGSPLICKWCSHPSESDFRIARFTPIIFYVMSGSTHILTTLCLPFCLWCQMAKLDPFLSLDCARVEGAGAQSKERKGSNFAA